MLTYVRYALATICFAASVACLALWCDTILDERRLSVSYVSTSLNVMLHAADGIGNIQLSRSRLGTSVVGEWRFTSSHFSGRASQLHWTGGHEGALGRTRTGVFFPLWYAALLFALAGVASLRVGRRFTLRSAIIATTVVAGLLGMAVIL
ncbi:hypothetical protein [Lacipirellula limnantheis]|uniref:Uncharacterized protein n=1 Tax=Lacipirellula limnantheis TaxID=2528024 RepID=A0A517U5Q9_9BACT|nr:hypothetical protein [Lacipirellula limnantheis]QDT75900.1 hypothetical protein I41_51450 [Lacipirellula limnantheis]